MRAPFLLPFEFPSFAAPARADLALAVLLLADVAVGSCSESDKPFTRGDVQVFVLAEAAPEPHALPVRDPKGLPLALGDGSVAAGAA